MGNLFESALFTGAGTPWGAPDKPTPKKPNYLTDPNQVQGYDYAPMAATLEQNLKEQGARQQQSSRAGLLGANPYGGTQGSAASRMYGMNRAGTEGAITDMRTGLAKQSYDERVAAMQAQNQALQQEYALAMQRANREEDQRNAFLAKGVSTMTAGLGG